MSTPEYRLRNKEKIAKSASLYFQKNKASLRETQKRYEKTIKERVIKAYSPNGELKCSKCHETRVAALTIDHIAGGGAEHRRITKRFGPSFYHDLIRGGFPKGYQTLCMNCQFVKRSENKEFGTGAQICIGAKEKE